MFYSQMGRASSALSSIMPVRLSLLLPAKCISCFLSRLFVRHLPSSCCWLISRIDSRLQEMLRLFLPWVSHALSVLSFCHSWSAFLFVFSFRPLVAVSLRVAAFPIARELPSVPSLRSTCSVCFQPSCICVLTCSSCWCSLRLAAFPMAIRNARSDISR